MAEAFGVDVRRIYAAVFTLGAILGTTAGALVVPTAAASLDMAIEFVIEAFAVVVIGGLGSMRGALIGALIVGLIRALSIVFFPELEVLAIYVIVIMRSDFPSHRIVWEVARMTINPAAVTALVGTAVLALLPFVVPPYYAGLMIPFFGYAIALLGFNLLFGYAGLLSFGHAMFLGLGAYGAAVMSGSIWDQILRTCITRGDSRFCFDCAANRAAVRALYRHLFWHAHARLWHAVLLILVQVLSPHRRRQRHARAAYEYPGACVRALQQDRVSRWSVLLLLSRPAGDRRSS